MLYLAIDHHRKQLTVNLRNEEGDVVLRRQVSTRWQKVRSFFEEMRTRSAAAGGYVAILEVCGFSDWLIKMLSEYDCREIVLIQPEKRNKQKTDRRDAGALGELLWANRHRLLAGKKVQNVRRVTIPTPQECEDRQLTELHKKTTDARTRIINRVHALLAKHNLHQECPTKGMQTQKARKWLQQLPLPAIDRVEMNQLLTLWAIHDEHLKALAPLIKEHQSKSEQALLLATLPGASAYNSLALACRVSGGIQRFPRPASLSNFWGLVPGCRNSGESNQRLGSITKAGSPTARRILGHLVLHVLRKDAWMRTWYLRIKRRRGSKIARVAVMRRLANIIWHMLTFDEPYARGGPPRVRLQRELVQAAQNQLTTR